MNVVLLGFDAAGHRERLVDASVLEDVLYKSMPSRRPHNLETGVALHVEYQMWYSVTMGHHRNLDRLCAALSESLEPAGAISREDSAGERVLMPLYSVRADGAVHSVLAKAVEDTLPSTKLELPTLVIINPPKRRFTPADGTPKRRGSSNLRSEDVSRGPDWGGVVCIRVHCRLCLRPLHVGALHTCAAPA